MSKSAATEVIISVTKNSGIEATIPPSKRNYNFIRDILIAFAVSVLPLLAFSVLLLGLIFRYRVTLHSPIDARFENGKFEKDNHIIYISLSATIFTTVVSWCSTVAPLSLPFILAIASYPTVRLLIQANENDDEVMPPTPYQFALVLRILLNSSFSSVWHCIVYMLTTNATLLWRDPQEQQKGVLYT